MALQFAIEECCRACGGHGFSQASALGALYENYLAQVTLGGRQSHDLSLNKQVDAFSRQCTHCRKIKMLAFT
ncbi:hypothetical protein PSHT_08643 [Puccinia striiformis]|uniref:Acyl-CoA oxidase C-alpha1 domain-containing protein n=4 Tax=Puccinia striiformis TaxID=27350 RepID=A0A0L0VKJ5_9BASI|nr:hypothetical protein PSTG_06891 [Puccinia striiformis f. sp. tritici PST-78]POW04163.1 hypothetical protein PSTT_10589 [Puccinia striiformis]POW10759.1 hypothetical protein PSHT_08643 [Puccinia striiformis]